MLKNIRSMADSLVSMSSALVQICGFLPSISAKLNALLDSTRQASNTPNSAELTELKLDLQKIKDAIFTKTKDGQHSENLTRFGRGIRRNLCKKW